MNETHEAQEGWTTPTMVTYGDVESLTAKGSGSGDGVSMHSGFSAQTQADFS